MSDLAAILAKLSDGIIPPDDTDAGASAVQAGPRLVERMGQGVNAAIYRQGVEAAERIAAERFGGSIADLSANQIHELLGTIRKTQPAFFKQLRMDVSTMYLSDPEVWQRIGFPGPSVESGGYPDFDRPQVVTLK